MFDRARTMSAAALLSVVVGLGACKAGLTSPPASEDPSIAGPARSYSPPPNPLEVSAFEGEAPAEDPHAGHAGHAGHTPEPKPPTTDEPDGPQ